MAMNGARNLSLYYQNVRSIRGKAAIFMENRLASEYDVYCISETWLREDISSAEYFPSQCVAYRGDRDYKSCNQILGGGVLIAIQSDMKSFRRLDIENYQESVRIEININGHLNVLLGNYYFPPQCDYTTFSSSVNHALNMIDFTKYRALITGNFNLPDMN